MERTPSFAPRQPIGARLLAAATLACGLSAQSEQPDSKSAEPLRHAAGHPDYGLPNPEAAWRPYATAPSHVCNQVFEAIYLTRCTPSQVALALPREHDSAERFFVPKWYFANRPGAAGDERLFGGDGRQMPIEGFDAAGSESMRRWLYQVSGNVAAELRSRPRAAVWFQHDLLRLLQRLKQTKRNPELWPLLLQCAQRIALPAEILLSPSVRTTTLAQVAHAAPGFDAEACLEIERKSTRLFNAEFVQLWSSIYLTMPGRTPKQLEAWLAAGKQRDDVPIGSAALLLQGIVAIDDEGIPRATDQVIEVRTQVLRNREPLAHDNPTTTRDGVDFAMWSLPRRAIRDVDGSATSIPFTAFRSIGMESQELFRDYGTRKHTTYAAQCTLCHRRSNTPDESIAGFSALRVSAKPRAAKPGERKRRAEGEMLRFLDKLREAVDGTARGAGSGPGK